MLNSPSFVVAVGCEARIGHLAYSIGVLNGIRRAREVRSPCKKMSQRTELEELVALTPYLKAAAALEIERELAEKARKRRRAEVAKLWLPGRVAAIIKDKIIMFLDNSTQHIMSEQRRRMFTQRGVRFFSLAVKVAFISILVGFTIKAYDEDQSTKFISITSSSPNYAYCDTVPNAITGTYSLDTDGYWSGSLDFSPGKGIYQFVFNNFEHSLELYKEWMLKAKENIAQVAAGASSRNLAMNLAYLMSWTYLVHDTTPPPSSISVTDLRPAPINSRGRGTWPTRRSIGGAAARKPQTSRRSRRRSAFFPRLTLASIPPSTPPFSQSSTMLGRCPRPSRSIRTFCPWACWAWWRRT